MFGSLVFIGIIILLAASISFPQQAWGAALTYQQTDTIGIKNDFACDGAVPSPGHTRQELVMRQGGASGTAENLITINQSATQVGVTYISPVNDPGFTSWQAGNWVVRFNVDPADTDPSIKWDGTCIFVVNSSGTTNKATVGSLTGQAIDLSTAGVKTMTISGSAQTVLGTDRVYIELVFHNNNAGADNNLMFFADQKNDTPLVVPPGVQVSSRSDTLSDSRPSTTSNHSIAFTTNNAIYGSSTSGSSTLTLALPTGFTVSAGMNCGDVDAATSVQFGFNYPACLATATAWGFTATGSVITLVPPSGTGVYVPTSTQITINIGSNATVGQQGAHWLTNPSTAGIYTISVGGTFGGSGNMLVSINSGVTVQATVAESLALTVSSVAAVNCTADDGASVTAIGTTSTTIPFGNVSLNTFYIGCQDLVVSTNAGNGYSITTQESSVMKTADGRFTIPDTTCDAGGCTESAAAAWTTVTKNGLGHTCFNQDGNHDCDSSYTNGTSGKNFRQFANIALGETPQAIMSSTTPASVTGRIKIRLSAGAAQAAGTYTTLITYTILGTF
jgi:hypothetical protein